MLQKERRKLFNTFHIVSRGNDIFVLNPFENETTVSLYNTSYNSRGEESRLKVLKCSASANVLPGHVRLLTGNYALQFVKKYRTNYVFFTIFITHTFFKQITILSYKGL